MSIFERLAAPFAQIHWRAQSVSREGNSAMALAYIDARDVMARLDETVGPENWSDRYSETPKGRLICTLSLRIGGEWIDKSDGAGETDVEGDKGAISDALKRAAVKWGIGRYLYDLPATWADCESYEKNGKKHWSKWTAAGLRKLQSIGGGSAVPAPVALVSDDDRDIITGLAQAANITLQRICQTYEIEDLRKLPASKVNEVKDRLAAQIDKKEEAA